MFVKVCGITRLADAAHAVGEGATAVGFLFWRQSPRWVAPERAAEIVAALPSNVMKVGVFVNEPADVVRGTAAVAGITCVQLHGDEPADYAKTIGLPVLRSVTLDEFEGMHREWPDETTFLLDAADPVRRGGTGGMVDWTRAAECARRRRVVLAGGLTPANVADAVARVRPFGVDVSSGVEEAPGVKDVEKLTRFLAAARDAYSGWSKD
jgi:phosphoribosylanthranilate isomerase